MHFRTFFEHITGEPSPLFRCVRIEKFVSRKSKPLLVKFHSEDECNNILRQALKLRDMQAEWPHLSISQNRTKKLLQRRQLRVECQTHQANGERVLIA